jgi:hypothetical protein
MVHLLLLEAAFAMLGLGLIILLVAILGLIIYSQIKNNKSGM